MDFRSLHSQLLQSFNSSNPDLTAIGSQLTKLKIALTEAQLLVPSPESDSKDLELTRDVLEVGAFWSIRIKDVNSFDRYMSLLNAFYNDYEFVLQPSQNHQPLLGLKLLRLLSSNQIAAFHIAIETLPHDLVQDSPFLQHPVNLERWLMEGSYSKVWRTRQQAPREEYSFFVDMLMDMIRHEIASCEEKAYDSLALSDAATLLFFDSLQDVLKFAQDRGWQVNPTTQIVHFAKNNNSSDVLIPKKATISSNLQFAKELESIV